MVPKKGLKENVQLSTNVSVTICSKISFKTSLSLLNASWMQVGISAYNRIHWFSFSSMNSLCCTQLFSVDWINLINLKGVKAYILLVFPLVNFYILPHINCNVTIMVSDIECLLYANPLEKYFTMYILIFYLHTFYEVNTMDI